MRPHQRILSGTSCPASGRPGPAVRRDCSGNYPLLTALPTIAEYRPGGPARRSGALRPRRPPAPPQRRESEEQALVLPVDRVLWIELCAEMMAGRHVGQVSDQW